MKILEWIKLEIEIYKQKVKLFKIFTSLTKDEIQMCKMVIDKVKEFMKDGENE